MEKEKDILEELEKNGYKILKDKHILIIRKFNSDDTLKIGVSIYLDDKDYLVYDFNERIPMPLELFKYVYRLYKAWKWL